MGRHLAGWRRIKAVPIWEGRPGNSRVMAYQDRYREVGQFANVLRGKGSGAVTGSRGTCR